MNFNKRSALKFFTLLTLILIAVAVGGISGWEYTNSDSFCTYVCHSVHPEEAYAHQVSSHVRVTCAECHIGRLPTLKAMAIKSTHTLHVWYLLVGYDRPLSSHSMKSSRSSCESCHSTRPHDVNFIRSNKSYAKDEANTETQTHLVMHIAGGIYRDDQSRGIRWHTENEVRFIPRDHHKQSIPWIEVSRKDGSTEVYMDKNDPLEENEIADSHKHLMDCLDCHNRIGHAFPDPEAEVDRALAGGKIDRTFPYIKATVADLFNRDFSNEEDALHIVREAWAAYQRKFPHLAQEYPEAFAEAQKFLEERQQLVTDLLVRGRFEAIDVSWKSFPDNLGHKDFPGCFRCHDGKHLNEKGEPVRRQCTLCHNVPAVISEGDPPPRFMNPFAFNKPSFHNDYNFPEQHKTHDGDTSMKCKLCHGKMEHGNNNSTFCSNRACHGMNWPGL